MGLGILEAASLVAFAAWVWTLRLWYRDLRAANGSRPLILMMLLSGGILTIMAFAMLNVLFDGNAKVSGIGWAAAMIYRVGMLAICVSLHVLHRQIQDIAHRAFPAHEDNFAPSANSVPEGE